MVLGPFDRVIGREMNFLKKDIRLHTWILFTIFLFSNFCLSYSGLSYQMKGWIFFCGIFLPGLIAVLMAIPSDEKGNLFQEETIPTSMPRWVWISAILVLLCLRFYRLTSFFAGPTGDEGLHGFLAIPLVSQWNWQFFYTVGEHPPLLIWALVPFFKWFDSPFFDLWFLPAFFSALAVPAGYWASRQFFSKSFSLLFGFLLAFSFWPLYFGRFCHQGLFVPFWELFGFVLLAIFLKSDGSKKRTGWALLLGLWIGLGSLTFTAWATVIFLFCGIMAVWTSGDFKARIWTGSSFFLGLFAGILPFLVAAMGQGYGNHLIDTSAASHYFSLAHQLSTHLSYLTCLFWGSLQSDSSYAPTWGGVLNPVLASFFFIGLLELFGRLREKRTWWILGAFLILLLPGLLSADYVEFNRVIQIMPVLLLVVVLGLQKLLICLSNDKRWVLIPLLLASFLLDVNHLLKPVVEGSAWKLNFKKGQKNEVLEAYRVLEEEYEQAGPGLVFADFLPLSHGHVLHVLSYHFNAAINPRFNDWKPSWAAILVNEDYQKRLEKRFPGSIWKPVTAQNPEQGGMVLGILPITDQDRSTIDYWNQVHQYFYKLNLQAENMYNDSKLYRSVLEHFSEGYPLVKGDPFLESCFGEWTTQFHWGSDHSMNAKLMERTLQKGYPCAHLYLKLGQFYFLDGHLSLAQQAFKKAIKCVPNGTNATDWLTTVNEISGQNKAK